MNSTRSLIAQRSIENEWPAGIMPPRPWPDILTDVAAVCGANRVDATHERFVVAQLEACELVLGASGGGLLGRIRAVAVGASMTQWVRARGQCRKRFF